MALNDSEDPKHGSFWGFLERKLIEVGHHVIENIETSLLIGGTYFLITIVVWYFLK